MNLENWTMADKILKDFMDLLCEVLFDKFQEDKYWYKQVELLDELEKATLHKMLGLDITCLEFNEMTDFICKNIKFQKKRIEGKFGNKE